ncbi:hypothetical protein AB7M37_004725 [Sinorhizobium fredii]
MVLIPPYPRREPCSGTDAMSLISSVRCVIAAEAPFDVTNLCYRVLGDNIVIEGTVAERVHARFVKRIAEDIAGEGHVILRLGSR